MDSLPVSPDGYHGWIPPGDKPRWRWVTWLFGYQLSERSETPKAPRPSQTGRSGAHAQLKQRFPTQS